MTVVPKYMTTFGLGMVVAGGVLGGVLGGEQHETRPTAARLGAGVAATGAGVLLARSGVHRLAQLHTQGSGRIALGVGIAAWGVAHAAVEAVALVRHPAHVDVPEALPRPAPRQPFGAATWIGVTGAAALGGAAVGRRLAPAIMQQADVLSGRSVVVAGAAIAGVLALGTLGIVHHALRHD